jgi:hypothetical protein
MLRKSTMLALTAFAVLGLAVSNASAMPGKPGLNGNKGPGMGNPGILKPAGGIKIIPSNPIVAKPNLPVKPIFVPKWPHPKPGIIVKPLPVFVPRPVVVGGPTYVVSRPVVSRPGPCTCLSNEYTQEGAVLFKDNCTREMAMNPPLQQQGAAEAPQQSAQYQR